MTKGRFEYWVRQKLLSSLVRGSTPALFVLAWTWRRLLFRTAFIAVTGCLGKTTAKECLANILSSRGPTFRTYRNQNAAGAVEVNTPFVCLDPAERAQETPPH
jgi:UDP-N-acetylmuramyl pentapeptide synthase